MTECVLCGRPFDPANRPCGVRSDLCSQDCQDKNEWRRQRSRPSDHQRQWEFRVCLPNQRPCSRCGRATTSKKEPPVCSQCQYHTAKTDRRRGETTGTASPERIAELAARAEAKLPIIPWRGI
jgi:hypothetical protein